MFIYKITVLPINKVYIGLDTKQEYKQSRWKTHQQDSMNKKKTKLHKAMDQYGIQNCLYEIISTGYSTISKLALAEIAYIKEYDSYKNGLNSTPGGDGLGKHNISMLTEEDLTEIKKSLGEHFTFYNKNIKWANTTKEERQHLTSHLHNDVVYQKKSATLKEFYNYNPETKAEKGITIKKWQAENYTQLKEQNKKNSAAAAEKNSKKIKVQDCNGEIKIYNSKKEFYNITGYYANHVISKTLKGKSHNGYTAWEI